MAKLRQLVLTVRTWFAGKKTILGGCVLIVAGVAGVVTGKLSVVDGMTVIGFGISICGWSAKTNRHQSEMLTALQAAATAGVDLRLGNTAGALAAMKPVLGEAINYAVPAVGPALAVNISGANAAEVLSAVSALTTSPTTVNIHTGPLTQASIVEAVNSAARIQTPGGQS